MMMAEKTSYTLLSDSAMSVSKALGIAYRVDEGLVERYKKNGTDGTVKFHYINPNYRVRLDPEVLLSAARASLK